MLYVEIVGGLEGDGPAAAVLFPVEWHSLDALVRREEEIAEDGKPPNESRQHYEEKKDQPPRVKTEFVVF